MPIQPDPLLQTLRTADLETRSDRLHYATGEMLGQEDFRAEQLYHRRQLARALLYLHGSGTLAGLKVIAEPVADPANPAGVSEVQIVVRPGLGIDRAGRIIEVPTSVGLRLRRWFGWISDPVRSGDPRAIEKLQAATNVGPNTVTADVFLSFRACNRGWTPAFASGPFDALDAAAPSRTRDSYELQLVLRQPGDPARAYDPWSGVAAGQPLNVLQEAIFTAYAALEPPPVDEPQDFHETPVGIDPNSLLLARLQVPASVVPPVGPDSLTWTAAAWGLGAAGDNVSNIDNSVRNFIAPPALLRRLENL